MCVFREKKSVGERDKRKVMWLWWYNDKSEQKEENCVFLEEKKQVCVSEREIKEKWCESDLDTMTNKNWIY